MASVYTHRYFYTETHLQRSFYTQQAFTHSKRLHTEHLRTVLLHTASVYTHRNFYTETLLHTEAFTHSKLLQKKFLHREAFLYIITTGVAAPKLDLDAKATKNDFEALFKRNFKRKIISAKIEKIC